MLRSINLQRIGKRVKMMLFFLEQSDFVDRSGLRGGGRLQADAGDAAAWGLG